MSYQIAFVIKADDKLSSMFYPLGSGGRTKNKTSQIGWWIPARGEELPPEQWTMNLMDININSSRFTSSTIRYLQTELEDEGLYTDVGDRIDTPYNKDSDDDRNQHETEWKFDSTSGKLATVENTSDSVMPASKYFVPIKDKT